MRYLDTRDPGKLHLTQAETFELAMRNLHRMLMPVASLRLPNAKQPIQYINDLPYESSRVLFQSDWAKLARKLGGTLIVAIPAGSVLAYSRGDSPQAIGALRRFALDAYPGAIRPVSTTVFRWTGNGWRMVN
jgi:uncharacterized protein YtpQ (UPF0354 family)